MPIEALFDPLGEPHDEPWCLAFCNTISSRNSPEQQDHLLRPEDLRTWMVKKGLLTEGAPSGGDDVKSLDRAVRLREAIFGIATAISENRQPSEDDLGELNWNVQRAMVAAKLNTVDGGLGWDFSGLRSSIAGGVGLIALSAAGLFASPRASRVRECNNKTCGWLFLDLSKNRSRKWCDMSDCGNLAKARRYYAKQKALRTV